jgi:hypothetical protein
VPVKDNRHTTTPHGFLYNFLCHRQIDFHAMIRMLVIVRDKRDGVRPLSAYPPLLDRPCQNVEHSVGPAQFS